MLGGPASPDGVGILFDSSAGDPLVSSVPLLGPARFALALPLSPGSPANSTCHPHRVVPPFTCLWETDAVPQSLLGKSLSHCHSLSGLGVGHPNCVREPPASLVSQQVPESRDSSTGGLS